MTIFVGLDAISPQRPLPHTCCSGALSESTSKTAQEGIHKMDPRLKTLEKGDSRDYRMILLSLRLECGFFGMIFVCLRPLEYEVSLAAIRHLSLGRVWILFVSSFFVSRGPLQSGGFPFQHGYPQRDTSTS